MSKKLRTEREDGSAKLIRDLAEDEQPLEQQLLRSGVPQGSMMQAEIERRGRVTASQQSTSRESRGNHETRAKAQRGTYQGPAPKDSQTAKWKAFVANVAEHDEKLRLQRAEDAAKAKLQAEASDTPSFLRDIYQKTTTIDGRRVEEGKRIVREVEVAEVAESLIDLSIPSPSPKDTPSSGGVGVSDGMLSGPTSSLRDLLTIGDHGWAGPGYTPATAMPASSDAHIWVEYAGNLAPTRPGLAITTSFCAGVVPTPPPKHESTEEEWLIDL